MKLNLKKLLCLCLSLLVLFGVSGITIYAEGEKTMGITLRIEGANENLFYKTVEIPYADSLSLQAALQYVDDSDDSLAITGADTGYITDINGESAGAFGGWDGWLFKVNDTDPVEGIDSVMLNDGDSVVLYYGDPYGVGMQFPVADTSGLANGVIKFTSSDTTYDADLTPIVTVNPVVGAAVTWNYGDSSAAYTADANGEIKVDAAQLTAGAHIVQISKVNDAGLPLVLRFASDYAITVDAGTLPTDSTAAQTEATETTAAVTSAAADTSAAQTSAAAATTKASPKTGDGSNTTIFLAIILLSGCGIALTVRNRRDRTYDK